MKAMRLSLLIACSLVLPGCTPGGTPKEAAKEKEQTKVAAEKEYPIKGKVVDVNPSGPSVRLDHEEIKGLMKSMEMEFDVRDRKILQGLRPGDQVHGHLKVEGGKYTIIHLEKHSADPAK